MMASDVPVEFVVCPVCGADRSRPYRLRMYRIDCTTFDLVRCECGFVYINPRPQPAALAALYADPDYYTSGYNLGVETENYFTRRAELIDHYEQALAGYERESGRAAGDFLELGSAGGFFLEAARRRGWRAKGVELSSSAAEYAVREFGHDVFQGWLEDAPFAAMSFDMALADNVLEHTVDPAATLHQLFSLLRPGGVLVVIVPTYVNSPWFRALQRVRRRLPRRLIGSHLLKLLKFDQDDAGAPYHILEFDRATLSRLVRRAGFDIIAVEGSLPR